MDKKLLKYWKNRPAGCRTKEQVAKRKEARVMLRIGDKVPEFMPRKRHSLSFSRKGKQKTDDEKRQIQIARMSSFFPEYENRWASGQECSGTPFPDFRDIVARTAPSRVCDNRALNVFRFLTVSFCLRMRAMTELLHPFRMLDRLLSEFDIEETHWKICWSACEKLFQDARPA
ncbi:MAG: hypothetical protein ACLRS8_16030 [Parabacteroides merdae]